MSTSAKNKILIVDDEFENIELYRTILEDQYRIESATTGEEAMRMLDSFSPDVILLDIVMPDISGLEICRRIRANEKYKLLKVLIVSGKTSLEERLEGYAAGADDYVTKPVELDELLAKVRVYSKLRNIEEVDQYKSTFMQLMNHETITPLNAIIGFSDLLVNEPLNETVLTYIKEIRQAGKRLHHKIRRISLLNDMLNSDEKFDEQVVELRVLVGDILNSRQKSIKDKNIHVKSDLQDMGRIRVISHEKLLFEVVSEVLENAIRFTAENSEINIDGERKGSNFILSISDQGPGLTEDQLRYGFNLFESPDLMHHVQGLCTSLVLARLVMRKFDGELEVKNRESGGALVKMNFRVVEEDKP
ncbi:MAG: response regulator [Gammaproteobacteria bacterium]|nr:response regulator [Gammaproteobacteria bacterium]